MALRGFAGWVIVASLLHVAAANDMYFRATVLDCKNKAVPNAYVSVYGCADKIGTNDVATYAAESKVIGGIDPITGYAGQPITEPMYCPAAWGGCRTSGLKVDFCSNSAQNTSGCNLAVMTPDPSNPGGFIQHPSYDPMMNVFKGSLQNHVLTARHPTAPFKYLYQTIPNPLSPKGGDQLWCPSPFPVCSHQVFQFKPKPGCCPPPPSPRLPTCPRCPGLKPACRGCKPTQAPKKASGYVVMCAVDPTAGNAPASQSYPTFVSFSSRQSMFASKPGLFDSAKDDKWGWMGQWPKTFVANTTSQRSQCTVRGNIYAGRTAGIAGTASAFMTSSPAPGSAALGSKRYSLTVTVNVAPNRLRELHIYFRCTKLTTNEPARFGNGWGRLNGVQRTTKTVSAVCKPGVDSVLYIAIHVTLN